MRSKEEAFDYRYFPEPDIPALEPSAAWIEEIRAELPELPRARRERYIADYGLKPEVSRVLVAERSSAVLFDEAVALGADAEVCRQLDHAGSRRARSTSMAWSWPPRRSPPGTSRI